jgi:peptidoglycan/xylan/chitin deacetylase (PgdA/CDA1 family)
MNNLLQKSYYNLKPFIPKGLLFLLRKKYIRFLLQRHSHVWPIDEKAGSPPEGWKGWPEGKQFALVLTHDVEREDGLKKCRQLAELEMELGFRSSFNFVAEDYHLSEDLRHYLLQNGFEIGLHGLTHTGNMFRSKKEFLSQAPRINKYLKDWGSVGFRAPSMYHNLEWIHELNIEYDASTFDTDPFEPQPDGMGTIFPFWVNLKSGDGGYVELPYTLPQDSTLFNLMDEKDDRIWREKLDWIAKKGGMVLINIHPDYMNFGHVKVAVDEYPFAFYRNFLVHIKKHYENQYWHALPQEISRFWRQNYSQGGPHLLKIMSDVKGRMKK